MQKLNYNTVTPQLKDCLDILMFEPLLEPFRLVGGTALSLKLGHRISIDIDLFTDAEYGSLDFEKIEAFLKRTFPYYENSDRTGIVGFGRPYRIGLDDENIIKLDLFYNDPFIRPAEVTDGIRFASTDDIVAMKMDVVSRKGRKKDFWDLHKLLEDYSIQDMIRLHEERYPWSHERQTLIENIIDFELADNEPDPICLEDKIWNFIKADFLDIMDGQ